MTLSRCGQRQVAAAALHTLDGTPVHSLALHSLHGDPSRTAESALVRVFVVLLCVSRLLFCFSFCRNLTFVCFFPFLVLFLALRILFSFLRILVFCCCCCCFCYDLNQKPFFSTLFRFFLFLSRFRALSRPVGTCPAFSTCPTLTSGGKERSRQQCTHTSGEQKKAVYFAKSFIPTAKTVSHVPASVAAAAAHPPPRITVEKPI